VGQDREHDVEVDVEWDCAGERVQAEGLDGLGEALFDVHQPTLLITDRPSSSVRQVITTYGPGSGWPWAAASSGKKASTLLAR
jgi:hypothetical protein